MFNFGHNKEMTPRPEKDQKFSMKNKTVTFEKVKTE